MEKPPQSPNPSKESPKPKLTSKELERLKLEKENQKLDHEIEVMSKKWYERPSMWIQGILPAIASIFALIYALSTGFFGNENTKLAIEKANLQYDIDHFSERTDSLQTWFDKKQDSISTVIKKREDSLRVEAASLRSRLEKEINDGLAEVENNLDSMRAFAAKLAKSNSLLSEINRHQISQIGERELENLILSSRFDSAMWVARETRIQLDSLLAKGNASASVLADFNRDTTRFELLVYLPFSIEDLEVKVTLVNEDRGIFHWKNWSYINHYEGSLKLSGKKEFNTSFPLPISGEPSKQHSVVAIIELYSRTPHLRYSDDQVIIKGFQGVSL